MRTVANENRKIYIHYHSDLSGDAHIVLPENTIEKFSDKVEVHVPAELLIEIVLGYVRDQKISKLEQMDYRDLLESLT